MLFPKNLKCFQVFGCSVLLVDVFEFPITITTSKQATKESKINILEIYFKLTRETIVLNSLTLTLLGFVTQTHFNTRFHISQKQTRFSSITSENIFFGIDLIGIDQIIKKKYLCFCFKYLENVFVKNDQISFVFVSAFLAVAGCDSGPRRRRGGIVDRVDHRLTTSHGYLLIENNEIN